jgi:hypothetical protein
MTTTAKPRSPKRPSASSISPQNWYNYYAGYSATFVEDVLASLALDSGKLIVDPWNGAGTTTQVADGLGVPSWGGDINPAMAVVAKARLLGPYVSPSELSLCEEILVSAGAGSNTNALPEDPLLVWFTHQGCDSVRALERCIARFLDPDWRSGPPNSGEHVTRLSSLASFFYLALFRTTKELLASFRSSNPTWIRRPADNRFKLSPSFSALQRVFRRQVEMMVASDSKLPLSDLPHSADADARGARAAIAVASSANIPLLSKSVGAVISSPPYCTRIDYAVSTAPELAVLGLSQIQFRELREAMIGSSTVAKGAPAIDPAWGATCANFLDAVAGHPSKASATYYLRNHLQYFDKLSRSLKEIDRILASRAPCVLVVQDSHYKELHNDLPAIVLEMASALGWSPVDRHDYRSKRHMGRVHQAAKKYRVVTEATESVLVFTSAA